MKREDTMPGDEEYLRSVEKFIRTRPKPRRAYGIVRDAEDLGASVRGRRKELGYTQRQLAEACRCSPRFVSELERGKAGANLKEVIRICHALGLDLFVRARGE